MAGTLLWLASWLSGVGGSPWVAGWNPGSAADGSLWVGGTLALLGVGHCAWLTGTLALLWLAGVSSISLFQCTLFAEVRGGGLCPIRVELEEASPGLRRFAGPVRRSTCNDVVYVCRAHWACKSSESWAGFFCPGQAPFL